MVGQNANAAIYVTVGGIVLMLIWYLYQWTAVNAVGTHIIHRVLDYWYAIEVPRYYYPTDSDDDGVPDIYDNCPLKYATYYNGCPAALRIIAENHTLTIETNRNKPKAVKLPLPGLGVGVYNLTEIREYLKIARANVTDDDDFDAKMRGKISAKNYSFIRDTFYPLYTCITNSSGECLIGVDVWKENDERKGEYLVMGVLDSETAKHLVRYASVEEGETKKVKLRLLEVPQLAKKISGKVSKIKASGDLYVLEPDYLVWNSTEEVYPYIIWSEDAWDVTTTVYPPSGWISDVSSLDASVNKSTDTAMFTLAATSTDVGTLESKIVARHARTGKRVELRSKVDVSAVGPLEKKIVAERRWWKRIPFLGAMIDGIVTNSIMLLLSAVVIAIVIIALLLKIGKTRKTKKIKVGRKAKG